MSELLRDTFSFGELQILSEGTKTGPMKVRGLFQEAHKQNGNKRVYARPLLEREIKKLQGPLKERRLVGELDHPSNEVVHLTNECYDVNENLRLITWDMVSEPSCHGAFPGLLGENQVMTETTKRVAEDVDHLRAERMFIHSLKKHLNK